MNRKSKGQNLNHLLNFHYQERPKFVQPEYRKQRYPTYYEPYDKKKYISANFRFILDPHVVLDNIDAMKVAENWDNVLCVVVYTADTVQCPICLDSVRLPRVTNCGHVYCLPCMLLYLATFDETKYPRCPICFEDCDAKELRPAIIKTEESWNQNARVKFDLLSFKRSNTVPLLVGFDNRLCRGVPEVDSKLADFTRCCVGNGEYLSKVFHRELKELDDVRDEAQNFGDHGRLMFVEQVKKDLENGIIKWTKFKGIADAEFVAFPKQSVQGDGIVQDLESLKLDDKENKEEKTYYFYQSASGQYIFLHPFNLKCLLHQINGKFEQLPVQVVGQLLELSESQITTNFIKRYSHLCHMPLLANISQAEVELGNMLQTETRNHFRAEMKKRKRQRITRQRAKGTSQTKKKPQTQQKEEEFQLDASLQLKEKPRTSSVEKSPPGSFASIVTNMGHYPELRLDGPPPQASTSNQTVWGTAPAPSATLGGATWGAQAPPVPSNAWNLDQHFGENGIETFAAKASKRGGKRSLFSNNSRRGRY